MDILTNVAEIVLKGVFMDLSRELVERRGGLCAWHKSRWGVKNMLLTSSKVSVSSTIKLGGQLALSSNKQSSTDFPSMVIPAHLVESFLSRLMMVVRAPDFNSKKQEGEPPVQARTATATREARRKKKERERERGVYQPQKSTRV